MEATDFGTITLSQIHHLVGGMGTSSENFVICKGVRWDNAVIGNSYRAEVAAVVLCRKGRMKMQVNLREHTMQVGSLMLYGSNNIIRLLEKSDDTQCDIIFFTPAFRSQTRFDLDMIMPIFNYVAEEKNDLLQLEPDECELIQQYFTLIRDSMQFEKSLIIGELVGVMFRTISELYGRRVSDEGNRQNKTRQQEYFERFVKQVSLFYREQRSVKFYADSLYITPKYLSTVIKEISGRSAAEWINEFVIQEAKVQLSYSTKSIQEITYNLNFSTQSFFGKYFKRHTGMSPSEFRAQKHL